MPGLCGGPTLRHEADPVEQGTAADLQVVADVLELLLAVENVLEGDVGRAARLDDVRALRLRRDRVAVHGHAVHPRLRRIRMQA